MNVSLLVDFIAVDLNRRRGAKILNVGWTVWEITVPRAGSWSMIISRLERVLESSTDLGEDSC